MVIVHCTDSTRQPFLTMKILLSEEAFKLMERDGKDQSIIVSGKYLTTLKSSVTYQQL